MTKREKIIVSAYTGVLMCDFADLHEHAEEILGRPVWTHEFARADISEAIKEKSRDEFLAICAKQEETRENELHAPKVKIEYDRQRSMEWVKITCSVCGKEIDEYYCAGPAEIKHGNYCPHCGARLKKVKDNE